MATVVIKRAWIEGSLIDPAMFVFSRFSLGFFIILGIMLIGGKKIRVVNMHYLVGRTIANCAAVYCFFKAVEMTSVAQANILNMTYPLFIAVFGLCFFKEKTDRITLFVVLVAFAGVFLILNPGSMQFSFHSLWGLASGLAASGAIIYLNLSRRVHDTDTTLLFLFGLGSVLIFVVFFPKMAFPGTIDLKYLLSCSLFSIAGQYLLTFGFKYVGAVEGGVISSTRILLAAILGPVIAMDPVLSVWGWAGAFLIFSSNVYLSFKSAQKES